MFLSLACLGEVVRARSKLITLTFEGNERMRELRPVSNDFTRHCSCKECNRGGLHGTTQDCKGQLQNVADAFLVVLCHTIIMPQYSNKFVNTLKQLARRTPCRREDDNLERAGQRQRSGKDCDAARTTHTRTRTKIRMQACRSKN